ncbi:hypothetical protein [Roseinatronobacter bogoriensis]|uniref:hypothetical protein n=1 Tax=Roseinatronobacter bogoriensis TaxID=119542 RepID=UPI001066E0AD|nr:hypothetical protein [Rhodobaca bogoriensis]MBB4207248.1 hypothetical protein [Rhodobaca bogoriensis DSM 18756]TDY65749.1 hypothetical protein EV660_11717 [Rhodobaca bogoriensis DSM 18756]
MKFTLPILAALAITACAPIAATGFNGDSVTIQSPSGTVDNDVTREASRICGTVNKRAEFASSTQAYAPQYMSGAWNHLFLCLS